MTAGARLRVLMVTPQFYPARGGVETHVHEVARRFVDDPDVAVTVLTTDRTGDLPPRELVDGIQVERVRAWPRSWDLYAAPRLLSRIRSSGADVVHVQSYHTLVAPLAMVGARRARLPYLVTLHSGGHSSGGRTAVRGLQIRLLRPLLAGARSIIAVSRFEADLFSRLLRLPAQRVRVIPNGADFPDSEESHEFPPAATPRREPDLILSVARLERYKGHHRLIAALPIVHRSRPGARLVIVGSGPYEGALRDLAGRAGVAGAVEIRGMPRPELRSLLARAAVVALLSDYESQGIAVYEALRHGCRVLVSESTALAELTALEPVIGVPPRASADEVAEALIAQLSTDAPGGGPIADLPTWDGCAARLKEEYLFAAATRHGDARSP